MIKGSDGLLYGCTGSDNGTGQDYGTIFKMDNAGHLTTLKTFSGLDGRIPLSALLLASDGNFYGTTHKGGSADMGTVFKLSGDGTMFTKLADFTGTNGAYPWNTQLLEGADGYLYGTTWKGGTSDKGTIFKISSTQPLVTVYSFDGTGPGAYPEFGLMKAKDSYYYGSTTSGTASANANIGGAIYRFKP